MLSALYAMITRPSVRPSVCLSVCQMDGWIIHQEAKLALG